MTEFSFLAAQVVDGIAYGSIYGLFALSLVLLFRSNKLFNLSLTEASTLMVAFMAFLLRKISYFPAALLTIAAAFFFGCFLHVGFMRIITERRKVLHSNESIMTIGFFTIFNSLSHFVIGDEPQPFPAPFGTDMISIFEIGISTHSIIIVVASILVAILIFLGFEFSQLGLLFEAVAENIMAARLRGIPASRVLAFAWGLTTVISTVGAILMAPVLFLTPDMLGSVFVYSLIAVVIGGLQSPWGALFGGVIVGVVENVAGGISFIGSELKFVVVMALLIAVLVFRPRGLWGRSEARRV